LYTPSGDEFLTSEPFEINSAVDGMHSGAAMRDRETVIPFSIFFEFTVSSPILFCGFEITKNHHTSASKKY